MPLNETMNGMTLLLTKITKDLTKAGRGNKSASQRIRVGTIQLEQIAKKFRKESIEFEKNSRMKKKLNLKNQQKKKKKKNNKIKK